MQGSVHSSFVQSMGQVAQSAGVSQMSLHGHCVGSQVAGHCAQSAGTSHWSSQVEHWASVQSV
jgi:hypothetical protein